ncbi:MAG: prolyl-tRNA synthetase associated domain-containing protein [Alphaproteobacteria bacterium]
MSDILPAQGTRLTPTQMLELFQAQGISFKNHHHDPVFTTEESKHLKKDIAGAHCKSLFVKDKKGVCKLLVCAEHWRIDMKQFAKTAGFGRPSFGKPELMKQLLGVTPGSVTPFALVHDTDCQVECWLDVWMLQQGLVNYHPLVNSQTTTMAATDLIRFLTAAGHTPRYIDLETYQEVEASALDIPAIDTIPS